MSVTRRNKPNGNSRPKHGQGLQQLLLLRRQPVDTRREHALHRGRDLHRVHRLGKLHTSVALQHAVFEQNLDDLLHEEGIGLGPFDDQALDRNQILAVAQQRQEHLLSALSAERVETQLRIIGLAIPLMRIFRPIIHHQQDLCGADRVGEQIQELLGLLVDPVQILEDHHQRLIQTLAQDDAFDRLQRPPLLDLPVHLRQGILTLDDAEQTEEVWQRVFQRTVEDCDPAGDLLAPLALAVAGGNVEVVA